MVMPLIYNQKIIKKHETLQKIHCSIYYSSTEKPSVKQKNWLQRYA
jgi:hypothetical protein